MGETPEDDLGFLERFGPAEDGQHRTGYDLGDLHISHEGIMMIHRHITTSDCMPRPLSKDAQIPLGFTVDKQHPDLVTIFCGICKKQIGVCAGGEFKRGRRHERRQRKRR